MSTQGLWGIAAAATMIVATTTTADAQSLRDRYYGNGGRCEAIAYQDVGYRGEPLRLSGDMRSLQGRWNDRISSVEVISGDWTFYEHDDYRGGRIQVDRDAPDMGRGWNDRISSARCNDGGRWWAGDGDWRGAGNGNRYGYGRGCEAIVYRDSRFRGEEQWLSGDTPWIGDRWNDSISSIRVVSGRWVFYGDQDFRGPSFQARSGELIDALGGGWNDRISSARCDG